MRLAIPVFVILAFCLGSARAEAKSCSAFVVVKSYDADARTIEVEFEKGKMKKYFPRPEGSPTDSSKIPGSCPSKVKKNKSLAVKPAGGRMSITQVRSNFEGKMLNDTDSDEWFAAKIKELVDGKTQVVAVIRPGMGKDAPLQVNTIYLPANEEDFAEIKRLEAQAEDL